jgi:signal transduction histidine kinase
VTTGTTPWEALRFRVLRFALTVLAVAFPAMSLMVIVQMVQMDHLNARTYVLSALTLSFPLLWLLSARLGLRATGVLTVGLLVGHSFAIATRGGITVATVSINVLAIVLAGILFGARGACAAWLAAMAAFCLAGFLVTAGLVPPVFLPMWDPQQGSVWVREAVGLGFFGGTITAVVVTAVRRLEAESRALREALALQEQERLGREAAERALEQARRIEAVGRLAGGVAHDFNNALTVIMSSAELAQMEGAPERVLPYLENISQAAQGASKLTRQLLALGHRHPRRLSVVSVKDFLERMSESLLRVLPRDVDSKLSCQTLAQVRVDASELERSLLNLVLNARDAMPSGGTLWIEAVEVQGPSPGAPTEAWVEIRVRDTGEGMDEETKSRIFEPFFSTKGVHKGSGLGLASVFAMVSEAEGRIDVQSTPGRGTTFTLAFKAYTDEPRVSEGEASGGSVREPLATSHGPRIGEGQRLLVVEDREDVRESIADGLTHLGFSVTCANDVEEGLRALRTAGAFDLMCVDGVMPGRPTVELVAEARAHFPRMKVLLCSGHVEEELLRRGITANEIAFLPKPFSPTELSRRVASELAL